MPETPGPAAVDRELDLATAAATLAATAHAVESSDGDQPTVSSADLLRALALLRWVQTEIASIEPTLIAAARTAGVSWQALAPALGVASRQAAERRYLRAASAAGDRPGATRDELVQAERDRRAGHRAVARWAKDNTADLRRLAGQVTALTDLDNEAGDALGRLHDALGHPDASALPALLAATLHHLDRHPDLATQIDTVTAHTDRVRRQTRQRHGDPPEDPQARRR
jgi:hypothetical protein